MQKLTAKLMEAMYALKHRGEHKSSKGFTLIELVVVIAIIAVLLALIAPNLIGYLGQAKSTKSMATAKSVYTATCAKNAAKPISKSTGLVKIAMTTGDLADYFNQEEIKDIKDGKVTAFMNNGTIEGVKVEYEDGSPAVYYPEGCEALFEGGEAEELAPDESPYNSTHSPSGGPGVYRNGVLVKSWDELIADENMADSTTFEAWSSMKALDFDEIVIKDTVTVIGNSALSNCAGLKYVHIPNSVTKIGNYAFELCSSLTSISLPSSIIECGDGCFQRTSLESFSIPTSIGKIPASMFSQCEKLKSITIPSNITEIGDNAFYKCYDLASITFEEGVSSIGGDSFKYLGKLSTVTLPDSIRTIDSGNFSYCGPVLTDIYLPSSVTSVANNAFNSGNGGGGATISATDESNSKIHYTGTLNTSSWYNKNIVNDYR